MDGRLPRLPAFDDVVPRTRNPCHACLLCGEADQRSGIETVREGPDACPLIRVGGAASRAASRNCVAVGCTKAVERGVLDLEGDRLRRVDVEADRRAEAAVVHADTRTILTRRLVQVEHHPAAAQGEERGRLSAGAVLGVGNARLLSHAVVAANLHDREIVLAHGAGQRR